MSVYYYTLCSVFLLLCFAQNEDYKFRCYVGCSNYKHSRSAKLFFIIASMILIAIAGFRYGVGTDYFAYYNNYEIYAEEFFTSIKNFNEPGFKLICWCVQKFGGNGFTVILISAFLTISLCMKTIYEFADDLAGTVMLLIFTGFWHTEFNAVRQCLAAAIVFAGIRYIKNRCFWKYLIVVLIASTFHMSALVMIVLYFVPNFRTNIFSLFCLVGGALIILQSFDKVLEWTGMLLNTSFAESDEYVTSSVNIFRVLVALVPPMFFLIMYRGKKMDEEQKISLQYLVMNAVTMLATSNSTYLARMGIYTMPFVALSIPKLIHGMSEQNRKITKLCVYVSFAFYWYYEVSHSYSLTTFQFIWQQ